MNFIGAVNLLFLLISLSLLQNANCLHRTETVSFCSTSVYISCFMIIWTKLIFFLSTRRGNWWNWFSQHTTNVSKSLEPTKASRIMLDSNRLEKLYNHQYFVCKKKLQRLSSVSANRRWVSYLSQICIWNATCIASIAHWSSTNGRTKWSIRTIWMWITGSHRKKSMRLPKWMINAKKSAWKRLQMIVSMHILWCDAWRQPTRRWARAWLRETPNFSHIWFFRCSFSFWCDSIGDQGERYMHI